MAKHGQAYNQRKWLKRREMARSCGTSGDMAQDKKFEIKG